MTEIEDLIAFLKARLDEDARLVETIRQGGFPPPAWTTEPSRSGHWKILREPDDPTPIGYITNGRHEADHIARHDPARVLREVEADRKLLDLYERAKAYRNAVFSRPEPRSVSDEMRAVTQMMALEQVLRLRAAVYSDHPDYDPECPGVELSQDTHVTCQFLDIHAGECHYEMLFLDCKPCSACPG